jgi:alkylhydroperoxidase family enzyme
MAVVTWFECGTHRDRHLTTVPAVSGWADIERPEDLTGLAPEATAAFDRVMGATAVVDLEGPRADPAVLSWADQFTGDVASLDDEQRSSVAAALGDDLFAYVVATWAADMDRRLRAAWSQLSGSATPGPAAVSPDPGIAAWPAIDDFLLAVSRLDELDPVTTEVVRLRGARANNCRLCRSRREVHAIEAGADETTFDAIDRYEGSDLDEPLKVALRLTDAVLWTPTGWPEGLVDEVRRTFSPSQAVELVYDIVRNAANRIAVALGADAPHVSDGVEYFALETDGSLSYGLPAPS